MPNWCNNNLYISGTEEDIVKFLQATCTASDFDTAEPTDYAILDKLVPCPQELAETVSGWSGDSEKQAEYERKFAENLAKYGHKDWYDWNYENWGTKWSDSETYLSNRADGGCAFSFQSPWASPEKGIETVSTLFPSLEFVLTYMEQGMGFVGACAYKDGLLATSYSEDITTPEYNDEDYEAMIDTIDQAYYDAVESCEAHVMLEAKFGHAKV